MVPIQWQACSTQRPGCSGRRPHGSRCAARKRSRPQRSPNCRPKKKKNKKAPEIQRLFFGVPRVGIEPTRLATQVFETCVSTNSTTWAGFGAAKLGFRFGFASKPGFG